MIDSDTLIIRGVFILYLFVYFINVDNRFFSLTYGGVLLWDLEKLFVEKIMRTTFLSSKVFLISKYDIFNKIKKVMIYFPSSLIFAYSVFTVQQVLSL